MRDDFVNFNILKEFRLAVPRAYPGAAISAPLKNCVVRGPTGLVIVYIKYDTVPKRVSDEGDAAVIAQASHREWAARHHRVYRWKHQNYSRGVLAPSNRVSKFNGGNSKGESHGNLQENRSCDR
jgi:hypothetical protein